MSRFVIQITPPAPVCPGSVKLKYFKVPSFVNWEYRAAGDNTWVDPERLGLLDMPREPTMLQFPPFCFPTGTRHQLNATTWSLDENATAIYSNFTVLPRAAPEASLLAPNNANSKCGFTLDASQSKDISGNNLDAPLNYNWSCQAVAPGGT